jgi:hypothetical protein
MFPQGNVHAEGINDGVMLSGAVASPIEAQQDYDLATRLVGDATKVLNGITIPSRDQVMIHVAFAEMDRNAIKQFGINVSGRALRSRPRAVCCWSCGRRTIMSTDPRSDDVPVPSFRPGRHARPGELRDHRCRRGPQRGPTRRQVVIRRLTAVFHGRVAPQAGCAN